MSEAFVRPFRPGELTASTLTSFPLQAMAQQLMTEDAFQTSGRNALTLIHHTHLTVVLTVLKAACTRRASRPCSGHAATAVWRDCPCISSGTDVAHACPGDRGSVRSTPDPSGR